MGKPILESDLYQEIKELQQQVRELGVAVSTKAPFVELKASTAPLATTETYQLIPGLQFTTPCEGKWLIEAYADMEVSGGMCFVEAFADGASQAGEMRSTLGRESVSNAWLTNNLASGKVLECRGKRAGGTATIHQGHTRMVITLITN